MKSIKTIFSALIIMMLLVSCNNKPSLQKYYVDNQENKNFIVADIPSSILNIKEESLTSKQQKAFKSIEKLNFLGFKKTPENTTTYEIECKKVKTILANDSYKTLIKYGSNKQGAVIKYLGLDNAIDEVIVFGSDDTKGFGVVRVLGSDMNPAQILELVDVIKNSNPDTDALKDIANFF